MKKIYNKIITLILVLFFIVLSIFLLLGNKKDFSENENRYLQSFPSFSLKRLFNGKYIEEFEDYLTDHFPFRDTFMSIKTFTDKLLLKDDINDVYLSKNDYLIQRYDEPVNNDKIISKLNKFYEKLNYVNMNLILAPTSISINSKLLPSNAPTYSEIDTIKYIYSKINFDSINVYDTLIKNNSNYPMYYKLDHHWTTYAAYYAYVEYAKANNIDYYSLNSFDVEEVTDSFNGTLYSKTNDYTRKSDSIYLFKLKNTSYSVKYSDDDKTYDSLYNYDYLDKKDKYSIFLDNNHSLIEITNNKVKNGKELAVIKDSYANSLIPFLVNHYEKVYVIDPRYYKKSISDFIKNSDIKDLLFVYNTNNIDKDSGILSIR